MYAPVHLRPTPIIEIMGRVRDTENVRDIETKYGTVLVDAPAKWRLVGAQYRVQILVNGRWRGTFPMREEDLEIKK